MRGIAENTRIPNKPSEPALNRCFIQNYPEAIKLCGFDSLEVKEGETEQDWQRATGAITVFYQPAADGWETVIRKRHSQTS